MLRIGIIGGTGFVGEAIVKEAVTRGHSVISLSRTPPKHPTAGVTYIHGSARDAAMREALLVNVDVVIGAAAPRGDMKGNLAALYQTLAQEATDKNVRFIVIGGFSSLRPTKDSPRYFETGDVPADYLEEATEVAGIYDYLASHAPEGLEWLFVSPAATFGAWANLSDTGQYRVGGDIALFDDNNESKISAGDFAHAVVDEIEEPRHNAENISFAW